MAGFFCFVCLVATYDCSELEVCNLWARRAEVWSAKADELQSTGVIYRRAERLRGPETKTVADFVVVQSQTSDPPGMEFFKKVEKSGAKESFLHNPPAQAGEHPQPEVELGNPQEEYSQQEAPCHPYQPLMSEGPPCAHERRSSCPPPRPSGGKECEASIASSDSMKHGRIFIQLLEADIGDARDSGDHFRIKNEATQLTKRRVYTKAPADVGERTPRESLWISNLNKLATLLCSLATEMVTKPSTAKYMQKQYKADVYQVTPAAAACPPLSSGLQPAVLPSVSVFCPDASRA